MIIRSLSLAFAIVLLGCAVPGAYKEPTSNGPFGTMQYSKAKERSLFDWEKYDVEGLDGQKVNFGCWDCEKRYFKVTPGPHTFLVRIMFNLKGGGVKEAYIPLTFNVEPNVAYATDASIEGGKLLVWVKSDAGETVLGPIESQYRGSAPEFIPPVVK